MTGWKLHPIQGLTLTISQLKLHKNEGNICILQSSEGGGGPTYVSEFVYLYINKGKNRIQTYDKHLTERFWWRHPER